MRDCSAKRPIRHRRVEAGSIRGERPRVGGLVDRLAGGFPGAMAGLLVDPQDPWLIAELCGPERRDIFEAVGRPTRSSVSAAVTRITASACFPECAMTSLIGLPFYVLQQRFVFGKTMLLAHAGLTSTPCNPNEGGPFRQGCYWRNHSSDGSNQSWSDKN